MTRSWTCRGAAAGLLLPVVVLAIAVAAWAKPGTVTTLDGKSYEGDVTVAGKKVKILMKGNIPVEMFKDNVASIEYAATVEEQFAQRLAKLEKNDAAGRVALARWAMDKKEYDLALDAVDGAIAIDPNNEEAIQLQRGIMKQRKLKPVAEKAAEPADAGAAPRAGGARPAPEPVAADAPADAPSPPPARRGAKAGDAEEPDGPPLRNRLVTAEEINRIKQRELQKNDTIKARLDNDVKRRYLASSSFTPQEFSKLSLAQQAFEILGNGGSKLAADVVIVNDPASLAQFKTNVQRYVLQGCAGSACHTAANKEAGDFFLHLPGNKDEQTYTNFLLLQNYKKEIDGKEFHMIDRAHPDESLLFHFGMPLRDSNLPHPKAQNFQPMFKGVNDPRFKQMNDWMSRTLAPIAPEYGVNLGVPAKEGGATTRPAPGGPRGAARAE